MKNHKGGALIDGGLLLVSFSIVMSLSGFMVGIVIGSFIDRGIK